MTVAVTGASGHLGRRVAELLLHLLDPSEVVLLTRSPDALDGRGAQVRRADFDDPGSLADAFAGVDRVLLISAVDLDRRVAQHRAAIDAAAAAGATHIAYTSSPNPSEDNPAAVSPSHRATEQALHDSGLAWTILRNNLYSEFQVPVITQAIAAGRLFTSAGPDGRVAYVSRDDCAAAAAAVLASDGHEGRVYDITGPEAVSPGELAAVASELGGKTVEVVHVDDEAAIAGMVAAGLPEPRARVLITFVRAAREGFLGTVSSAVEDLTGTPPRSLRDVLAAA